MFLATSNSGAASPSYYLVSGDYAVYVYDPQTVQSFKKVGVPVITFSPADLTALTTALKPPVVAGAPYVDNGLPNLIDGGAPNTIYYADDFDGGVVTDDVDAAPPADGNHS